MPSAENPSAARRLTRQGSEALERLKRGELTLEQYTDDRIERAIGAIPLRLTERQREAVRETLRQQLATDPVIAEYTRLLGTSANASHGQ